MSEVVGTLVVRELLKTLKNTVSHQISLAWNFNKELLNMKKSLRRAEAFIQDIHDQESHGHSLPAAVMVWVEELHDMILLVDDLLDEVVYEELRRKVNTNKFCNLLSPSHYPFLFHIKLAKKMIELTKNLDTHYSKTSALNLVLVGSSRPTNNFSHLRHTTCGPETFETSGRESEVSFIVNQVLDFSRQQVLSIIPIVGMGGLGKTTFAQLVFNHEMIKTNFEQLIWVCVSDPLIIINILEAIFKALTNKSSGVVDQQFLLQQLQKEIKGKSFFLVLDDVWNENVLLWMELKSCLLQLNRNPGNCILVTTRSDEVAQIMGTLPGHHLEKLSDDRCWSIFKESACVHSLPVSPKMDLIKKEIIAKFGGIPLAARMLGASLQFQGDHERWVSNLKSVIRLPMPDVLSVLKVSVDRLPSSTLKRCFAYCSNFPKNFEFKNEHLVQMWIAQGFIQPQEEIESNYLMEDIGDQYFNILLSHCLFQDLEKDEKGRTLRIKMHDLIHDVASISISQKLLLKPAKFLDEKFPISLDEKDVRKLRTLIYPNLDTWYTRNMCIVASIRFQKRIANFVYLRVLILDQGKLINDLPDSTAVKLKHLKYLEISEVYSDRGLPKCIGNFLHLQTLRVKSVVNLPVNLIKLLNLRHVEFDFIHPEKVKQMPPHLGRLTQLQTFPYFVVGCEEGCRIEEVGLWKNLKGNLNLLRLDRVKSKEEAMTAKLDEKENLRKLSFNWIARSEREGISCNDSEVLEGLQPPKNLQSLCIENFAGECLASSIFVENLVRIELIHFSRCKVLPMLGQLPNLEVLVIRDLPVRSISTEFYGNSSNHQQRAFFPRLKKFALLGMARLERWEEVGLVSNGTTFPRLRSLIIDHCPKLMSIPSLFGSSQDNDIQTIAENEIVDVEDDPHFCLSFHLKKEDEPQFAIYATLYIVGDCPKLTLQNFRHSHNLSSVCITMGKQLPEGLADLPNLEVFIIRGSINDYDLSSLIHLSSLKFIGLWHFDTKCVAQLPQQLENLTALQQLYIENFDGIKALPEWFKNFTALERLNLTDCRELKCLPSREAMLHLTKLKYLSAENCPQLRLSEGDPERAKVSHVPRIIQRSEELERDD